MHSILIAGAVLAGLPILLHLIMKQEPKRLPFPALRFLKQKQRTNQRKMRLRHFLLLAMRVLLIALFALTLFQPTIHGEGFYLAEEQPVQAVFVLDTTPSMGYVANERSRLDDARRRALTLLDELPAKSRVAIVDPADPVANWEPSVADARRHLETLKAPRGGGPPITTGLATAYQLLRKADEDADAASDTGPLPRLVAIFSDRTAASWDASRNADLLKLREAIPPPTVAHLYADVGAEQPTNVAILTADVRPQVIPQNQPVTLNVTVQASGTDVKAIAVQVRVDNSQTPERKEVSLKADTPIAMPFMFRDLKPGFHQVEVTLGTPDRLAFDNTRNATFRVGESRKILTITDDPEDAIFWQLAHRTKGEFDCEVKTPAEVKDFAGYEAVCLLSVADPSRPLPDGGTLWAKLADYANRGGKVLIMPDAVAGPGYDPTKKPAEDLLPGKLARVVDRPEGASWLIDDKAMRHPLMAPFRDWKLRGNVDFLKNPRRAWKFWEVEAAPENVVVSYEDADLAKRFPAVLERTTRGGGKVVLLTVRMDSPWEPARRWHNYWETAESSWAVVFPNLLMRYLAGDSTDANFHYTTGQTVTLPLPKGTGDKPPKLILEGPGVTPTDAFPTLGEKQTELRLLPGRTLTAGNFVLRSEDGSWREAFSLNPATDESNLEKVPATAIEELLGTDVIVRADKERAFRDIIAVKFDQPLDLFPWLLIAVLLLLALESAVANRFYRPRT